MKLKQFSIYWLPVIIYAVCIFIFSSISRPPKAVPVFPHSDKLLHFIEYALFGFLMLRALFASYKDKKSIIYLRFLAVFIVIFYGATDEIHQYFVPLRHMDVFDLLTDSLGAFIGQLFFKTK